MDYYNFSQSDSEYYGSTKKKPKKTVKPKKVAKKAPKKATGKRPKKSNSSGFQAACHNLVLAVDKSNRHGFKTKLQIPLVTKAILSDVTKSLVEAIATNAEHVAHALNDHSRAGAEPTLNWRSVEAAITQLVGGDKNKIFLPKEGASLSKDASSADVRSRLRKLNKLFRDQSGDQMGGEGRLFFKVGIRTYLKRHCKCRIGKSAVLTIRVALRHILTPWIEEAWKHAYETHPKSHRIRPTDLAKTVSHLSTKLPGVAGLLKSIGAEELRGAVHIVGEGGNAVLAKKKTTRTKRAKSAGTTTKRKRKKTTKSKPKAKAKSSTDDKTAEYFSSWF